jgi:hypothetical protein
MVFIVETSSSSRVITPPADALDDVAEDIERFLAMSPA